MLQHEDLEAFAGQFFDLNINPMADIVTRLMHMLVQKEVLSKQEATYCVAEAIKVIKPLDYSEAVKEQAAKTLMRMIETIDRAS